MPRSTFSCSGMVFSATPSERNVVRTIARAVAATPATTQPAATRTQVAVVGLVSVASIATFKRMLARAPGVRAVQVASGPDGEFLFSATHEETVDMAAVVAGIQGFQVEVVESSPGIVNARAVDPEVV